MPYPLRLFFRSAFDLFRWQGLHRLCRLSHASGSPPSRTAVMWSVSVTGVSSPFSMHRTQSGFARLCALASLRQAVWSYRPAFGLLLQLLLAVGGNQGGRFDRGTVGIVFMQR